ncbi:MAG: hypothetical protein K940chlam7_01057 [Chlamydiae bacterium]|nr:hypothetical protein [Chlamydiota bacterium]
MSEIGDTPSLITPGINWSEVDRGDIEHTAKELKAENPELSEDTITSWLLYMKEHNVSLTDDRYNKLLAGDPILTRQEINEIAMNDVNNVIKSNPWLAPNATTMFTIAFLELAYKLSEIKMGEAEVAVAAMGLMMEMSHNIAALIQQIAKKEARMHYASAVAAGANGVFSLIGGLRAGRSGVDSGHAMAITQKYQAGSKFVEAGTEAWKGILTTQKGKLDSRKQIEEALMRLCEKLLDQALGAYKSKDDEVAQILQKLTQIISEAYKAHSLQAH